MPGVCCRADSAVRRSASGLSAPPARLAWSRLSPIRLRLARKDTTIPAPHSSIKPAVQTANTRIPERPVRCAFSSAGNAGSESSSARQRSSRIQACAMSDEVSSAYWLMITAASGRGRCGLKKVDNDSLIASAPGISKLAIFSKKLSRILRVTCCVPCSAICIASEVNCERHKAVVHPAGNKHVAECRVTSSRTN